MAELCPIVLLHGGLADHRACAPFALPLRERFTVLTPDLPGAGANHHAGPLDWDLLADHVAALAPRMILGGVSFGAAVAVRVALRHPGRVAGLVLLSPAYGGADLGMNEAQRVAMAAMDEAGRRTLTDGIEALVPLFDRLPDPIRDRAKAMVRTFDPPSVAATTALMASLAQPFERGSDLAAITAPTLLVPGTDPTHPPEVADVFARHLPHVTIRRADPPDYAAAIADFAAGLG